MDHRSVFISIAAAALTGGIVGCCLANSAAKARSSSSWRPQQCSTDDRAGPSGQDSDSDAEVEIPDQYKDPISLSVIVEPVVLCATGQVYCYSTIREWFKTGNRLCPRTNIEVQDVQLTRLPWLKQEIRQWCEEHGVDWPQEDSSAADEKLRAIHADLPSWVSDIKGDSGIKRIKAAAAIYDLLRQWEVEVHNDDVQPQQQQGDIRDKPYVVVRSAVMDDMVWLLRYGDAYMQGVAASTLSFCNTPEEVQWLTPIAAAPTVALCLCPQAYTAQAATRLLYNLARAGSTARRAIHAAGGALSLLKVISTSRQEFGYGRDRAAATLAVLAKEPSVRAYLQPLALQPLKAMLQQGDRYEQRDASIALLGLLYNEDQLKPETTMDQLFQYFWCSRAWLEGRTACPDEQYTLEELQLRSSFDFWRANAHAFMDQLLPKDLTVNVAAPAGERQDEAAEAHDGERGEGQVAAGAEL